MPSVQTECFSCQFHRSLPGDAHIRCVKPDGEVQNTGHPHGIKRGWFLYPYNFDPTWKTVACPNYHAETMEKP